MAETNKSNLQAFMDFEYSSEDEEPDTNELLEAYTNTLRPYSHGYNLSRYFNGGSRQLTLREFAALILERISCVYDSGELLINITFMYVCDDNTNIYRSIGVKTLSSFANLADTIISDTSFVDFVQGSNGAVIDANAHIRLSTKYFEITTLGQVGGSVKTITMGKFAKLLNTSSGDYDCVFDCISYATKKEFNNIPKIRKFIGVKKYSKIPTQHVPIIAEIGGTTACVYEDMINYEVDDSGDIKVKGLKPISGEPDAEVKLVLKNNHYYFLVSELDVETQIQEIRRLVDSQEILDPRVSNRDNCIYMFFDYETIIELMSPEAIPYCFSYIIYDVRSNDMVKNAIIRTSDSDEDIVAFYENIAQVFNEVGANRKGRKYLIGYNNSGFDNFLLIRQAIHSNFPVTSVLIDSCNRILSMMFSHFKVFDLYRVLGVSLKKACASFGIKNAKLELSHEKIQDAYYRGEFENYINKNEEHIIDYAIRDVESLMELFFAVKDVVKEQTTTEFSSGLILEDELTTAGMTYKAFKNSLPEEILEKIPITDLDMDKTIRKAVIGGRTQVFIKGEIKGKIRCIDVTSLYPYIMMFREFPLGQPKYTKKFMKNKIGIYHVSIHKQPKDKIIPFKGKDNDSYDWDYEGVIETWVTQEDIRIMDKFGATYIVIDGYYWEDSSKTIFEPYMGKLMAMKMQQDVYKEQKEKLTKEDKLEEAEKVPYNPVLREMLKLWLNALSGKVIQRVFTEEKHICFNIDEMDRAMNNLGKITQISSIGDVTLLAGEIKSPQVRVPSIWGVLIYSYARSYMYENFISKSKTKIAMDTDSLFFLDEEYFEFLNIMSEIFGDEPGQMKEELKENKYGIFKAKKFYIIYTHDENGNEIPFKVRWKGVHDTDKVIIDPVIIDMIENDELSHQQLFNLYYYWWDGKFTPGGKDYDMDKNPIISFKFDDSGKLIPMGKQAYSVNNFREMCNGKKLYVLCNQLRKNIMNANLSSVSINNVFLLKKF